MAENLTLPHSDSRSDIYTALLPQIQALIADENDPIANMANVAAVLREALSFFWVGFYRVMGEELVLGPFQGTLACTRIGFGKGVCGMAWKESRSQLVPDVELFSGHIACNSQSRSEVVIPIFGPDNKVTSVLDIDSDKADDFTAEDVAYLEQITQNIANKIL